MTKPASSAKLEAVPFELDLDGRKIAGESVGEGRPVVLAHGLTATRRQVVHGSLALARKGYAQTSYDARGHGSSDPAPEGGGYTYPELVADLGALIEAETKGPVVVVGHSMGSHTVAAYALENPDRVAGVVIASPVYPGFIPEESEVLDRYDRLADALESGGVDGFLDANDVGTNPEWRETIRRFTRERMLRHEHPEAIVQALRQVPRSEPFRGLEALESMKVPALVVASRDVADPRHPLAVAEAYAERIPGARSIVEEEGESPLPWQGGRFSREIAGFIAGL
ncbi:MAG: alpha/beta fold hydrolase [Solirubrobacterales bacterium]